MALWDTFKQASQKTEGESGSATSAQTLDKITLQFTAVESGGLNAGSAEVVHIVEPTRAEREELKQIAYKAISGEIPTAH